MQDLLEWLWVYIADPILQKLGFTETPAEGGWERLCWIPIGRLSKLPLHAAGIHKGRGGYSVLDRVVSSYATSVKSLISIRKDKPRARQSSEVEVLLVSMENTPRLGRLYYAAQEVEAVREICTRHAIRTKQPPSLKEDVMRSLGTCTIFHFAGHGEVDVWDPTKSRLLLSDWEKPNKSFDVGSLVDDELGLQENPPHVAYLSACKTAQTDDQISDEGLHLVGAFQLAGFRHVIGTLWSVADDTCKAMAEVMYEELFAKGLNDDNAVAWALHKAMRTCRDAWRKTSTMNTTRSDVTKAPEKDHKGRQGMRESREDTNIKVLSEAIGIKDFSLGEERGRDVGDGEDMPLNWVPYVHYGP
ncbi:hypothetical protein GQ53DRAFT_637913 [Thozetella sp. PMI_491]|nr:hypothetical protein GQ53DRAFT_637913 [Thozetella sp. PMI_491]